MYKSALSPYDKLKIHLKNKRGIPLEKYSMIDINPLGALKYTDLDDKILGDKEVYRYILESPNGMEIILNYYAYADRKREFNNEVNKIDDRAGVELTLISAENLPFLRLLYEYNLDLQKNIEVLSIHVNQEIRTKFYMEVYVCLEAILTCVRANDVSTFIFYYYLYSEIATPQELYQLIIDSINKTTDSEFITIYLETLSSKIGTTVSKEFHDMKDNIFLRAVAVENENILKRMAEMGHYITEDFINRLRQTNKSRLADMLEKYKSGRNLEHKAQTMQRYRLWLASQNA